jgi:hypothetical protein
MARQGFITGSSGYFSRYQGTPQIYSIRYEPDHENKRLAGTGLCLICGGTEGATGGVNELLTKIQRGRHEEPFLRLQGTIMEKLTLNDHLEKFRKVIECKWHENKDIKKNIDTKVKILERSYRLPEEDEHFVLYELFNMYLLGGYDRKYDPAKSALITYITIFVNSKLDRLIDGRRKKHFWENGERYIGKKKIRFKSGDIQDNQSREIIPDEERDVRFSTPENPESIILEKEITRSFWKFAEERDRINEAKIILGLEDYDAIARQTTILKDTICKRVHRLVADFKEHYYGKK